MSYIDTIAHKLSGVFGGVPLYQVLEDHVATDEGGFSCQSRDLILGGGEGEHPAIRFKRPDQAVLAYLDHLNTDVDLPTEWDRLLDSFRDVPHQRALEFPGWRVRDFVRLHEWSMSVAHATPCGQYEVEDWLLASVGEHIWFEHRSLVPSFEEFQRRSALPTNFAGLLNVLTVPLGTPSRW